jgi:lactate permease
VWSPGQAVATTGRRPAIAGGSTSDPVLERKVLASDGPPPRGRELFMAFVPYLIIIVILGLISLHPVIKQLDQATSKFSWPGLHILTTKGKPPTSEIFKLNWFTAAGSGLLVSGLITALVLRVRPGQALRIYGQTLAQIKWALVTVCSVLAVA